MAIPGFQDYMNPLLEELWNGQPKRLAELYDLLAERLNLTDEDLALLIPSGSMRTHVNRVQWACTFLIQAGLLQRPQRAHYAITERGLAALDTGDRINIQFLNRYPEFVEFRSRGKSEPDHNSDQVEAGVQVALISATPDELVREAYQNYRTLLEHDLLERVKTMPPSSFERLVVRLLVAMGYGGTVPEAAKSVGRSGDGGIDGIINEDRLGLDVVYVQAKRWANPVGARDVRDFSGSLDERRAAKGVFITTSSFTRDAERHVDRTTKKIVLIDGERLVSLMVEFNIGVQIEDSFAIKKIDEDYFSGE